MARKQKTDDQLLWSDYLYPAFRRLKYPGAMYRVGKALCDIQAGRHVTVYAGAWGLSKRSGVQLRYVKKLLARLQRDGLLQKVEWSKGGRFSAEEKADSPGVACGFELGRATLPNGVHLDTVKGVHLDTVRAVEKSRRTVSKRTPQANGVHLDTPTLVTHSLQSFVTRGGKEGLETIGTPKPDPKVAISNVKRSSPRGNGLRRLGQIFEGLR